MTMHVYKIIHKDSGQVYVGLTAHKRWRQHVRMARRSVRLARAMQAFGVDRFEFEVIETVPTYKLGVERQIYWIAKFKQMGPVYNVRSVSYEHRVKLSQAQLQKPYSAETRAKIRAASEAQP